MNSACTLIASTSFGRVIGKYAIAVPAKTSTNELPVLSLDLVELLPSLLLLLFALALHRQDAVVELHLDVFFLDLRQISLFDDSPGVFTRALGG